MFEARKAKLKALEAALEAQVKITDEKNATIDKLLKSNQYLAGESNALKALIDMLKEQLKTETERATKFQDFWMKEFSSGNQLAKVEGYGSAFEEDPEIVEEIQSRYRGEQGDL